MPQNNGEGDEVVRVEGRDPMAVLWEAYQGHRTARTDVNARWHLLNMTDLCLPSIRTELERYRTQHARARILSPDSPAGRLWIAYQQWLGAPGNRESEWALVQAVRDDLPAVLDELVSRRAAAESPKEEGTYKRDLRNAEVAEILGVSTSWVRRCSSATLPFYRLGDSKERRYHRDDVERLAARTRARRP